MAEDSKKAFSTSNPYLRRPCAPMVLWDVKRSASAVPAQTTAPADAPAAAPRHEDDDLETAQVHKAVRSSATHHFVDDVGLSAEDGVLSIIGAVQNRGSTVSVPVSVVPAAPSGEKRRLSFKDYAAQQSSSA